MVSRSTSNCRDGMIAIPAGSYQVGSDRFYPEEAPVRQVSIASFEIDQAPVTNAEFLQFVDATGYQTVSERPPDPTLYPDLPPEEQIPESVVFLPPPPTVDRSEPLSWWALIAGADWRHPQGPDTNLDGLMQHPVVHVAFEDALAYADWAGKRLPTADEWEVAARGGLVDQDYAWGAKRRRMVVGWPMSGRARSLGTTKRRMVGSGHHPSVAFLPTATDSLTFAGTSGNGRRRRTRFLKVSRNDG